MHRQVGRIQRKAQLVVELQQCVGAGVGGCAGIHGCNLHSAQSNCKRFIYVLGVVPPGQSTIALKTSDLEWRCDFVVALQEQRWGREAIAAWDMAAARIAIVGYAWQRPRRLIGSTKQLKDAPATTPTIVVSRC
ncbi:hypothetical protein XFF6166_230073 [Xanthomonas citri pv. fuscans]|nr:hypothetical protein XFF6166_230073 [Xanthomonas citri pv. fuscans]SON98534.1 hypothetical protein XFF6960_10074 [Xanthomonas citri pv. fuscans]SOO05261.1 hypothetical protein XFF7767_380074 [Xanthomonas citri pv. fuscans]SOO43691.1 hypothetical protein XFF1815_40081 [Xanthomonas citri pv. fuscans]